MKIESDKSLNMSEFDKDNNANVILDGRKIVILNSSHPSHAISPNQAVVVQEVFATNPGPSSSNPTQVQNMEIEQSKILFGPHFIKFMLSNYSNSKSILPIVMFCSEQEKRLPFISNESRMG